MCRGGGGDPCTDFLSAKEKGTASLTLLHYTYQGEVGWSNPRGLGIFSAKLFPIRSEKDQRSAGTSPHVTSRDQSVETVEGESPQSHGYATTH